MATPPTTAKPWFPPPGTIVPARGVVIKGGSVVSGELPSERKVETPPDGPVAFDDPPIVPICPCFESMFDGLGDGVPVRYDGNWVFMNDMPSTGGPWGLAFQANGQPVWVNLGGL